METLYDVDCVERVVRHFLEGRGVAEEGNDDECNEAETPGREASRRAMLAVGRLIDAYLGEIATDANLKPDKFCDLAWALPDGARVYDDGLYRAVDIYLKVRGQRALVTLSLADLRDIVGADACLFGCYPRRLIQG